MNWRRFRIAFDSSEQVFASVERRLMAYYERTWLRQLAANVEKVLRHKL